MSYFTLKNGMKLYYEDVGNGQPIVLMHGWTSSRKVYSEPVKILSKKFRCIAYDHRGHRKSKSANLEEVTMETLASDLDELIKGLNLSEVTLVGWSMGAGVAMTYIREYGCSALKQVVLCDMTPKQLNDSEWKLGLYKGRYTKADMKRNENKSFLQVYKLFAVGAVPRIKKLPDFMLRRILKARLMKCDETVMRSLSKSMKEQDNRKAIESITVPLAYFYAVPGTLFSPKLADWYKNHVNVPFKAVGFPKSTHMLITENPEKFAEELGKLM